MVKAYLIASGSGDPRKIESASKYIEKVNSVNGVKQAHFLYGPDAGIAYCTSSDPLGHKLIF